MMPDNLALIFTSLWFSLFLIMLSISSVLFCFECIGVFNTFLVNVLCILYSHELAVMVALRLYKKNKNQKK